MAERSEVEPIAGTQLVVPGTGEVVDLTSPTACALALATLRDFKTQLGDVEHELMRVILDESKLLGTKTMHLDGVTVEIKGGKATQYDPEYIAKGLLKAGMPADRVKEIVVEKTTRSVSAANAKQAASASPEYRKVIEKGSLTVETNRTVSVKTR